MSRERTGNGRAKLQIHATDVRDVRNVCYVIYIYTFSSPAARGAVFSQINPLKSLRIRKYRIGHNLRSSYELCTEWRSLFVTSRRPERC